MKIKEWYQSFETLVFKFFDKIAETKVGEWLGEGTKWGWLIIAFILGCLSDSFYCCSLVGGTAIIAYGAHIGNMWKLRGSYLLCVLMLLFTFAGYGLVELLTEK